MLPARQTPRGARPNRRGGLARPAELRSLRTGESCSEGEPSGRLLEPHRELRPRGMIVTAQRRKAKRRTESGLQAHPPLSCLFSLESPRPSVLLCLLCACYLKPLTGLHYTPCAFPQFPDERSVMPFDRLNRVSEELCDIV